MSAALRVPAGFTLVEVMVAFAVLGTGLLGTLAILGDGMRSVRTAFHRTTATELAADLAERIRANRAAGDAYRCTHPCTAVPTANPRAGEDLRIWLELLQAQLPIASGGVEATDSGGIGAVTYLITVNWAEAGATEPAVVRLRIQV